MSNPGKIFCFGYGYTASHLAARLQKNRWSVAGTTRNADKAARMKAAGVTPHIWEGGDVPAPWLDGVNALLVSAAPGEEGCPALNAARESIAENADRYSWVGYLSSNGVYGDHDGAWVDEETTPRAQAPRAIRRLAAEKAWRALAAECSLPLVIFRLPGIYGPGRSTFDALRIGTGKRIFKTGQVFNRMHVEDIARYLEQSINKPNAGALFNLCDDEPSPPQDVVEYAATLMGVAPPPLVPLEEAALSPMARSFYKDNKRVSNARVKSALGDHLTFPTYREGLRAILSSES